MPLPPNCSISLQGHSRPGEATTRPKIAMVVRMTEQALDALQNLSGADRVDFEFGDKPGIYVRDQFFSMRYDRERENQELFIRTMLPNRANAPLRLNANVVGKFAVEQVLNEKISQRLHNATAAAAKQKAKQKAILVDSPVTHPVSQTAASKKKGPPKGTPKSTPTIVKSYATSVSSQAATASASSSASLPTELATMYRQRLVHYLALGPATVPDIFKEFGGSEIDHNVRAGIMDILIEIAEQEQLSKKATSAPQVTSWRLKPQAWLEVRPYQYSGYTENVRTKVARMARQYLSALKIPENDPAWDHVKYRDGGHGNAASNAQAAQRAMNGTSTAVAKAKVQKAREAKLKGEVKAKSVVTTAPRSPNVSTSLPSRPNPPPERSATPTRSIKGKERVTDSEKEEGELSASQTPPSISSTPVERRPLNSRPNGTSAMPPPPLPMSSQPSGSSQPSSSASSKRSGPVDARGPRRPPEPSQPTRAAPPIPPPTSVDRKPVVTTKIVQQKKKERALLPLVESSVGAPASSSQSAKERVVVKKERDRERESDRESIRMSRKERERESDRESTRGREREKIAKERDHRREKPKEKVKGQASTTRPGAKSTTKRKASGSSDEESSDWGYEDRASLRKSAVSKIKREQDSTTVKSSSSSPSLKIPRWESSSLKQKVKRDPSPLPPTKMKPSMERKVASTSSVPQTVKKEPKMEGLTRSSTTKAPKRRRSIDFTSSSEEEEEKPKLKASKSTTKTSSSVTLKNSLSSKSRSTRPTREDLRTRYSTLYTEYLSVLQKLVAQKNVVQNVLRRGSESPSGDSDIDADMMPLDELEELTKRHQRLYDELEEIRKNYMD